MTNPQFVEEKPLGLVDTKVLLDSMKKRDIELNPISNKVNEYLETFVTLSHAKKEELHKNILSLDLTRLREEHIIKIIDFLPATANDLKIVLQAYPLSLPKKDQDSIVAVVKDFLP